MMTKKRDIELADLRARVQQQEDALRRVRSYADYLDTLAPGDKHYAARIKEAIGGAA